MNLCRSFYITKKQYPNVFPQLLELCHLGKNLYNQMLYYWYRWYDVYEKSLSFFDFCWMFKRIQKPFDNYRKIQKIMGTKTSDYSLQMYNGSIQSYFKGLKEFYKNPHKFKRKPNSPRYIKQYYFYFVTGISKCDENGLIRFLPMKNKDLQIQIPKHQWFEEMRKDTKSNNKIYRKIKQTRFYYVKKNIIRIEIIYEKEEKPLMEKNDNVIGIDLGVNNLAAIVSNKISPILIDGRVIKSVNHKYNKESSLYKSKLKKCSIYKNESGNYINGDKSNHLDNLIFKRNNKIKSLMHKFSSYIIDLCIENNITTIIVGKNKGWKNKSNMGKRNNQNFVQIPFDKFISMIEYKSKLQGIKFIETEESYTSKTDNMMLEYLYKYLGKDNKYNEFPPKDYKFIGKRPKRGYFISSNGKLINADINAGIGILRKKLGDGIVKDIINPYNPKKLTIQDIEKVVPNSVKGEGDTSSNQGLLRFMNKINTKS